MTPQQLAEEAKRILENDAARDVLAEMRQDALAALATVEPTDAEEIRTQQSMVKAVDKFLDLLEWRARAGADKKPSGIV